MRKLVCLLFCCCLFVSSKAQLKWYNPMDTGFPVIQNQGFTDEIGKTYVRLPDRAKEKVRDAVWYLSRNSAGLAICFYSNAPEIKIRYAAYAFYRSLRY